MATRETTGPSTTPHGFALGVTAATGVILMLAGAFGLIQGIVALFNDTFYVVGEKWVFQFDATAWGWVHILLGLVAVGAGIGLFVGKVWAQAVAIIVAAFSILANFTWLPYYPVWAMVVIAFDLFVIWAIAAHGKEFRAS